MQRNRCGIYIIALVFAFLFSVSQSPFKQDVAKAVSEADVKVHYIDVGQGDATFIELPDGKTMLIDGGTDEMGGRVVKYIKDLGYKKIDYLIATHSDSDHVGGLDKVLEKFEVAVIYRPFTISVSSKIKGFQDELYLKFGQEIRNYQTDAEYEYAEFLYHAYNETCDDVLSEIRVVSSSEQIVSTDENIPYMIKFFWPRAVQEFSTERIIKAHTSFSVVDNNNSSAVIELITTNHKYLFMGDLTSDGEGEMISQLSSGEMIMLANASVLKVGHHGSATSTSEDFLNIVRPKFAVISCGKNNDYGHPSQETLDILASFGAMVYRTDYLGTIIVGEENGILYFDNIETKTIFEKYSWAFYLVIGLVVVGIIATSIVYPRIKKRKTQGYGETISCEKQIDKSKKS